MGRYKPARLELVAQSQCGSTCCPVADSLISGLIQTLRPEVKVKECLTIRKLYLEAEVKSFTLNSGFWKHDFVHHDAL